MPIRLTGAGAAILTAAALCAAPPAMACSLLGITFTGNTLSYNPFEADAEETYTLSLQTDGQCNDLSVMADIPASGGRPASVPAIRLTDATATTTFYSNASGAAGPFTSRTAASGPATVTLNYAARTDGAQAVFSPVSSVAVPIDFTISESGTGPLTTVNRSVSVEVVEHLSAHFAGANATGITHTLNLGTLSRDAQTNGTVGISLETNVDYDISFSSFQGGSMEISAGDKVQTAWQLPYELSFDNGPISFTAANVATPALQFTSPVDGTPSHDLSISVDPADVRTVRAGRYSDTITVEITARD